MNIFCNNYMFPRPWWVSGYTKTSVTRAVQSFARVTCCLLTSGCDLSRSQKWQKWGIKHKKCTSRKAQAVMERKQTAVSILGPLKQSRNHSCQKGLCSQRPFSCIFSNDEALTGWNQSIEPDCISEESLMSLLQLFIALSLFQLITVVLISWPELALGIAGCC